MSLISIISFIICLLVLLTYFKTNADIFSPGKVFTFIWALTIGLVDLKLSRLQHHWTIEIWIQILIGPLAFLIGVVLIYAQKFNTNLKIINSIRTDTKIFNIDTNKLFIIVFILFSLFLIGYIFIYLKSGEIPLFSSRPGKARANFTMFGFGLFLHNVVLIVFFTSIYCLIEKKRKLNRKLLILFSFVSVLLYSITLQRNQIIMTFFMVLVLYYYTTFRVKFKTLFFLFLLIVSFFYLISSFRAGEVIIYTLYEISQMKYSKEFAIFTEPYMYVVMNLENYARAISQIEHYTFGYYTFDFITAISGIKHWISDYFGLIETPFLISGYNTYSAFWTYYRDFGIIGIFFIPFLGGVLISTLYYSFRKSPTLKKLSILGMFLFTIIFSFFISFIGFLWFFYNLILLLIIFKYITIKTPDKLQDPS